MFPFLIAARNGWLTDGRFMGRVFDEWADDAQEFVRTKLPHLLMVAVIAFLLSRLLRLITLRMIRVAEQHGAGLGRIAQVKTLSGIIRTTGISIIAVITGLQFLAAVGIDLGPLLASAGIAGVAIGLAAQNIVKDMLNGILILIEDQFNVGDTVRLAGLAGVVEAMTLRKTTVRDADGTLYVIPNSQITTVANLSAGYTVATVNISVDYSANPDQVLKILGSVAHEIRHSDEYRQLFVSDPEILGVDAIKGSELIFPVVFKTLATKQYGPIREFRRRVRLALEQHHVLPGNPYRVSSTLVDQPSRGPAIEAQPTSTDPTNLKPQESNPFSSD